MYFGYSKPFDLYGVGCFRRNKCSVKYGETMLTDILNNCAHKMQYYCDILQKQKKYNKISLDSFEINKPYNYSYLIKK